MAVPLGVRSRGPSFPEFLKVLNNETVVSHRTKFLLPGMFGLSLCDALKYVFRQEGCEAGHRIASNMQMFGSPIKKKLVYMMRLVLAILKQP